jgi:hypothetical protein
MASLYAKAMGTTPERTLAAQRPVSNATLRTTAAATAPAPPSLRAAIEKRRTR